MKKFLLISLLLFYLALTGCSVEKFDVQFLDYDGTELKKETIEKGKRATPPIDPNRIGYTFTGWDKDFSKITNDLIVTAEYLINTYSVTFLNYDGFELKRETVEYGKKATAPVTPTRTNYTFTGWDKEFTSIDKDLIVTAQFVMNSYLVQFIDHDGTELKRETIVYGNDATAPTNPTRVGYTFTGWNKTFNNIKSVLVVTAQYQIQTYTVSFIDEDESVIATELVGYNTDAPLPSNPTKKGYTFTGWDKVNTNITSNTAIKARYEINNYTLTYSDNLTKMTAVQWDSKEAFLNEFYTDFYTWIDSNVSRISNLTKEGTKFTMTKSSKTATWNTVSEMRALDKYDVERTIGTIICKPFNRIGTEAITPDIDNGYFLNTEPYRTKYLDLDRYFLNVMVKAYSAYNMGYDVDSKGAVQIFFRFHQWNQGTTIPTFDTLPSKNIIDKGNADITIPESRTYNINDSFDITLPTYTGVVFLGWYDNKMGAGAPITKVNKGTIGNITLYAKWDFDTSTHEVIFVDNDGTVLLTKKINKGESITPPRVNSKEGYTFIGWDKDTMNIKSDITFTAQYDKIKYTITYNPNTTESVTLPTEPLTYTIDDKFKLPQASLEGYIFVGWYKNPECTGDEVLITSNGNLNLYARWIKKGQGSGDGTLDLVADETILEINRSTSVYVKSGSTYLSPTKIKFFSENPDIAIIDENGFVITKGLGKVTILAVVSSSSATIELTVQTGPTAIRWVGHRGSGGQVVENTASAFEEGGKRGYYALECDVRVSSDGVYYICHDDIFLEYLFVDTSLLNKLMGGYSWDQLKTYQVKDTYSSVTYYGYLATVEEYLNICKQYGAKAVLELKWTNGINSNDQSKLDGLVDLVKKCGMYEDAIFMSSMKNCLTYLRSNHPDSTLQFLSGSTTTNMDNVKWCIENRISLDATNDKLTKGLVDAIHNAGLYVNAYTVNSSTVADNLIAMGVDMITTDNLGKK